MRTGTDWNGYCGSTLTRRTARIATGARTFRVQMSLQNVDKLLGLCDNWGPNLPSPSGRSGPMREHASQMNPPIHCERETHSVWLGERRLDMALSAQEFSLLSLLCSRYGSLCVRDDLGAAIWGEGKFGYGMLHRLVNRTKRKIGPELSGSITSVAGVGYRIELPRRQATLPVPNTPVQTCNNR